MSNPEGKGGWRRGESGNPAGRPCLPAEIRAIKKLSPAYVRQVIAKLARMDREQMVNWLQTPLKLGGPNNLELMVASIIVKATTDGDHTKLNFLLDRSIGKVVEERKVQLEQVRYRTTIRADGALMQEVLREAVGEDDDGGSGES